MDNREKRLVDLWERLISDEDMLTNREVFYIMFNYPEERFETQDECDDTLAKLISEDKLDKTILSEDDYYKYNKNLEEIMKKK